MCLVPLAAFAVSFLRVVAGCRMMAEKMRTGGGAAGTAVAA